MSVNKFYLEIQLKDKTKIKIGRNRLKEFQSLVQSNSDASTIYYGVLPSTGSFRIIDTNGEIKNYIETGQIDTSSLLIDIYINGNKVRSHISVDSDYINTDRSLEVRLGDTLDLWSEINFSGYYYPEHSETAYDMLKNIFLQYNYSISDIDNMLSEYTFNQSNVIVTIKAYLESIIIEYPYLPSSTLREVIDKFCVLAQLNCILNSDGSIRFISARPLQLNNNVIFIPRESQYTSLSKSILLKNKYDAVEMNEYNVSIVKNTNTIIGKFNSDVNEYKRTFVDATDSKSGAISYEVYLDITYFSGEITLIRRSNKNLSYITKIYTGVDDNKSPFTRHTVNYEHYKSDSSGSSTTNGSGQIATFNRFSLSYGTASVSIPDESNLNNLPVTIDDNKINIKFKVATGKYERKEQVSGGIPSRYVDNYTPTLLEISFYGDIREIKSDEISANSGNIDIAKNPINIQTSELFEQVTTINDTKISDIVKNNILSDYSVGIPSGTIRVAYTDYYYTNFGLAVSAKNGEIISVGQYVQIEGDANIWRVCGVELVKQGYPYCDLEVMEVKEPMTLQNSSWEEITRFANNGIAENVFNVGDEKNIALSTGEEVTLVILGFNHDDLSDGSGKAGITFGMKELLANRYEVQESGKYQTWLNSSFRTTYGPQIYETLPEELRNIIKYVNKSYVDTSNNIAVAQDKLWLPAISEITDEAFGRNIGMRYEYWKNFKNGDIAENRIKKLNNGNGNASIWATRNISSADFSTDINEQGGIADYQAGGSRGISLCFCI